MNKTREPRLDLIRTIAIIMICFNHAISSIYIDQINYPLFSEISLQSKLFMVISYIISRLGVPLFLFLTGALILNKDFKNSDDIKNFYKNNLLSLFITVEIWNTIYYFLNMFINNVAFNIGDFIQILTLTKRSVYGHMWYMPMILGMYLFIPYISMIVKKVKLKSLIIPISVVIAYSFVFPYLNVFLFIQHTNIELASLLDITFSGAQYGMYIILGYYIYKNDLYKKPKTLLLILFALLAFVGSCIFQGYLYKNSYPAIVYYNFIGILIFSICIYMLLLKTKEKENKITKYLSKNSLAIFYIHFPILELLKKYVSLGVKKPLNVFIFYVLTIIISILLIEILKRIKIIKKYLLRQ